MPFYIRNLRILGFCHPQSIWNKSSLVLREYCIYRCLLLFQSLLYTTLLLWKTYMSTCFHWQKEHKESFHFYEKKWKSKILLAFILQETYKGIIFNKIKKLKQKWSTFIQISLEMYIKARKINQEIKDITGVPVVAQWLTQLITMRSWFHPWPHSLG